MEGAGGVSRDGVLHLEKISLKVGPLGEESFGRGHLEEVGRRSTVLRCPHGRGGQRSLLQR